MKNKRDNENKKIYIFLMLMLSFIVGTAIITFFVHNSNNHNEYSGIKWNGVKQINNPTEQKYIAVSGFTDLKFVADSTKQSVNFYNPKENNCLMDLSIIMNGDVLWQAENIRPDYGLYTIDLCSPLKKGEYPACIVARFKTIDGGTKLNSATFKIKIIVGG